MSQQAFKNFVFAAKEWADHMDQWEKFKFETAFGPIYVTVSMQDQWPDSFDTVDPRDWFGD